MSAISAAAMRVRTMADGSLRIEVEVQPTDAQAAFALFGRPGAPMALAALVDGYAAVKEPEKPKGGERAKWVAMRCQEFKFWQWLRDTYPRDAAAVGGISNAEDAAIVVRGICEVDSRAELDTDKLAAERFDGLIRKPYSERA